ncbi:MAG: glutathione S-transferase family protein [Cellvibrionaceae bacterium]
MKKLILYTNPQSRGRIVRWMLEEIGQPYDVNVMEYGGSIKSAEYLAINPMGKVPALVHGDVVVTEVVAICTYLADQFPEKHLAPAPSSPERGAFYRWMFFAAGPLELAMTAVAYDWEIDEKMAQSVGCGLVRDTVSTLEKALANGPYICGDQFTAADVVLGSYIGWFIMQKQLEPLPVFAQYVERMQSREAHQRADKLDNDLMRAA